MRVVESAVKNSIIYFAMNKVYTELIKKKLIPRVFLIL